MPYYGAWPMNAKIFCFRPPTVVEVYEVCKVFKFHVYSMYELVQMCRCVYVYRR